MENEKTAGSSGRNKLDLSEYIYRYLKCLRYFWPWVLILALLFGAGYAVKEYMDFTPYYTSQAKFIVSSGYTADDLYSSR